MTYFIYKTGTQNRHPAAGFEIGLGRGVNANGETWHLGRFDEATVGYEGITAAGCAFFRLGIDDDASVEAAAPWLRNNKASQIRGQGAYRLTNLTPYLMEERDTWFVQKSEALALQADPLAVTPLLTAIANARGVDLVTLAALVLENVTLFERASGTVLGTQQRLLGEVYTKPLAEMIVVEWPEA